jgi:hypothetical protein
VEYAEKGSRKEAPLFKHCNYGHILYDERFIEEGCNREIFGAQRATPFLCVSGLSFSVQTIMEKLIFQGSKVIVKAKTRAGTDPSIQAKLNDKLMLKELLKLWGADPYHFMRLTKPSIYKKAQRPICYSSCFLFPQKLVE